uniref:Serum amyloid A n=1 Tax=Sparus aurata TaxID=8175 RepID=A0A671VHD7_SPAAU
AQFEGVSSVCLLTLQISHWNFHSLLLIIPALFEDRIQGDRDMGRAYTDMREANWKNSDKGPGGRWAATVISNGRAAYHIIKDRDRVEIARDQEANRWGRNGGDPNRYRPRGLLSKY